MQIRVLDAGGIQVLVDVECGCTVEYLKRSIASKVPEADVARQRLIFGGKELTPNSLRIEDFGVSHDGAVVHLVLRPNDGTSTPAAAAEPNQYSVRRWMEVLTQTVVFCAFVDVFRVVKWSMHGQLYLLPLLLFPLVGLIGVWRSNWFLIVVKVAFDVFVISVLTVVALKSSLGTVLLDVTVSCVALVSDSVFGFNVGRRDDSVLL